jgi:hypothetical protein
MEVSSEGAEYEIPGRKSGVYVDLDHAPMGAMAAITL